MDSRAQLNMMEVLVCIGLLIIAFIGMYSVVQVAEREESTSSVLRELAYNALGGADEAGLLRPALYEANATNPADPLLASLETYFDAVLPATALYSLRKFDMDSSVSITLQIGDYAFNPTINPVSDSAVVKYFVGGYIAPVQTYTIPHLAILYVWRI
ncbi:MAG: hypothetical protein ACFFDI_05400 [Promethearchaeota archaeon]